MNVWCGAGIPHDQDLRPEQEEAGGLQRTEDCRRHGRGNLIVIRALNKNADQIPDQTF